MANKFYLTGGLPVQRDGTADTGSNKFHVTAGLLPEVSSAGGTTYYQSVAGDIPAMSGIVSTSALFSASLVGDMPASTGIISKLIRKGLVGSLSTATGTIAKLIKKGVSGNMPASSGVVVKLTRKLFGGSMPAATGDVARSFQTTQATTGILGAFSGIVSTVLNPLVSAIRIVKIIGSNFRKFLQ